MFYLTCLRSQTGVRRLTCSASSHSWNLCSCSLALEKACCQSSSTFSTAAVILERKNRTGRINTPTCVVEAGKQNKSFSCRLCDITVLHCEWPIVLPQTKGLNGREGTVRVPAVPAVVLQHVEGGVGEEGGASHGMVARVPLGEP